MKKIIDNNKIKAFTLIELLVVIAIIGILAVLAVVALQSSRASARDSKRLADVKQIQTALELYFNDNNSYPTAVTSTIATGSTVYMTIVPAAPTPADGICSSGDNNYTYYSDGSTYSVLFCLGSRVGSIDSGRKEASASGVINYILPEVPWSCGEILIDSRDSQQYPTIQIGTQCWMAKSINYDDGCSSSTWTSNTDTRWCGCYNNDSSNCTTYGKLYQWSAAMAGSTTEGAQGICPSGWHVPSSAEFVTLENYLGGSSVAGGKLKQVGTTIWSSPNSGANNSSGFTSLPAGYRYPNGGFGDFSLGNGIWTSYFSGSNGLNRGIFYNSAGSHSYMSPFSYSFSVRCLKD